MTEIFLMSAFWYGLLLKIAMTAGIVVGASVIVERSGPFLGSLIAALPTAGGAAMIILASEHPPSFIAQSVVGGLVSNAACAIFALTYAALAQRRTLLVSLGGAFAVWFCAIGLSRIVGWTTATAVLVNVIVYPLTIYAGSRFRLEGAVKHVPLSARDLIWRAIIVTSCVIVVTTASNSIGSYFSGVFAFFPVAMGSFFVILHPRIGGPAAASVAAYVQLPLIGLSLGLVGVHYLAVPLGVWWSYGIGLCIGIAWNLVLWTMRQWRNRASAPGPLRAP